MHKTLEVNDSTKRRQEKSKDQIIHFWKPKIFWLIDELSLFMNLKKTWTLDCPHPIVMIPSRPSTYLFWFKLFYIIYFFFCFILSVHHWHTDRNSVADNMFLYMITFYEFWCTLFHHETNESFLCSYIPLPFLHILLQAMSVVCPAI